MHPALQLYHETAFDCSKKITSNYSTSFSLAIKLLDKRFRDPICGIYGFVRFADEIVDTFHEYQKEYLLDKFEQDTYQAIEQGISLNPVLHAFQLTVREYNIGHELIDAFLQSMRMDLSKSRYNQAAFDKYVYGSAEVVGLMCLKVFTENNADLYEKLKAPACKLGSAFQKLNFLRDVQSDFEERGRLYFPEVEWKTFDPINKQKIEAEIEQEFREARIGILNLPKGARLGVYIAYLYYNRLLQEVKAVSAARIMQQRIRVSNAHKLSIIACTYLRSRFIFPS